MVCRAVRSARLGKALFNQDGVTPRSAPGPVGHERYAFSSADFTKPMLLVKGKAGGVLGDDARLDGPHPGVFCVVDEPAQELASDAATSGCGGDVDGVFDDTGVGRSC